LQASNLRTRDEGRARARAVAPCLFAGGEGRGLAVSGGMPCVLALSSSCSCSIPSQYSALVQQCVAFSGDGWATPAGSADSPSACRQNFTWRFALSSGMMGVAVRTFGLLVPPWRRMRGGFGAAGASASLSPRFCDVREQKPGRHASSTRPRPKEIPLSNSNKSA
jgi:hypothetical protein